MFSRLSSIARAAAFATLVLAVPASAQTVKTDGRWQAWLGCWSPANALVRVVGKSATSVVCVVPTATASAVDVMTVTGGKIADRNRIDTDGQPHSISKDGCTGWQNAKWSPSSRRVYVKSEFSCAGAPPTRLSAIFAMAGSSEWLDVQGMTVEKKSGVNAIRYREAIYDGSLPDEIKQKLEEKPFARSAAMLAATQPISLTDVAEASREVDATVVSTWLIEADKVSADRQAQLNAKELVQLANSGVPGSVIDVMVGLSYPKAFAVNPSNGDVTPQNADSVYAMSGYRGRYASSSLNPILGFDRFGHPIYESEASMLSGCTPYMYGPYSSWDPYACSMYGGMAGYGYFGYPYGYNAYGYGYGYPYFGYGPYGYPGGYYGNGGPVVVPINPGTPGSPATHGRVGPKGYSQGGSSGTTAAPRADTQSGSSSSSSGSGSSGTSSPPPPPPRTAVPRKP